MRTRGWVRTAWAGVVFAVLIGSHAPSAPQDPPEAAQGEAPQPPRLDSIETDTNGDNIPDGWYNFRDAKWTNDDGPSGPRFIRLHAEKPMRPARASKAFALDGQTYEAVVVGLWVRVSNVLRGEREATEPRVTVDFLGDELRYTGQGRLGPWTRDTEGWVHVAQRMPIQPDTHDVILTVSLWGATGTLDFDGLSIDPVPIGGSATNNLVVNGDMELGGSPGAADYWQTKGRVERESPGRQSHAALVISGNDAWATAGLGAAIDHFGSLAVRLWAKPTGLRLADAASANIYFFGEDGRELGGAPLFKWSGASGWAQREQIVPIPSGAHRAAIQIRKSPGSGSIAIDDVEVTASPNADQSSWTPFHVQTDTGDWPAVTPSEQIKEGSALDASFLLKAPAGSFGPVEVKSGRFAFKSGKRVRFFGATLLPPLAFPDLDHAEALADRLARSGINLVEFASLDTAIGAGRSLFDDSRDDTLELDPIALEKFDHLVALLKARGIYITFELLSSRIFRSGDGLASHRELPAGGGPAAGFDPVMKKLVLDAAKKLLIHVNPETGLPLKDDPVLAFVTISSEQSLFNLAETPDALTPEASAALKSAATKLGARSNSTQLWRALELEQWESMAVELRRAGLKAPIAGCSHFRPGGDFWNVQASSKLDFINSRIFWFAAPLFWNEPTRRSQLWQRKSGIREEMTGRRRTDRPFVLGQWCSQSAGAWALPYEAGDFLLGVQTAKCEDWDAIVRRGVFLFPEVWGANPAGTGGGEDIFPMPQTINGMPQIAALMPHAASLMLRGQAESERGNVPGRLASQGRLTINNAYTQGIAGWWAGDGMDFETLSIKSESKYAVIMATSLTSEPIASTKRLLVTAVARVEPTGLLYVDEWRNFIASPGRGPFVQEQVEARVAWRTKFAKTIKAFAVDNGGARVGELKVLRSPRGNDVEIAIEGGKPYFHFELVSEQAEP